jgi:hypothetical protein
MNRARAAALPAAGLQCAAGAADLRRATCWLAGADLVATQVSGS